MAKVFLELRLQSIHKETIEESFHGLDKNKNVGSRIIHLCVRSGGSELSEAHSSVNVVKK